MRNVATISLVFSTLCTAQDTATSPNATSKPSSSQPTRELSQKFRWPADKERVICVVAGTNHTLDDLIEYLIQRHAPNLRKLLELRAGRTIFDTHLPTHWVRHYADIMALREVAKMRGVAEADVRPALEQSLKSGFEKWFDLYWQERKKAAENKGRTIELTQAAINIQLARFQQEFGLETELGGWLGALVPLTPTENTGELRTYFSDNPRIFGGRMTVAHILIRNRDSRTGELFVGDDRRAFLRKLASVKSRLESDGSNFEQVARLMSDDSVTAREGGLLRHIKRFDPLLPAAICRTAWATPRGKVSEPFESPLGIHFVKNLDYIHLEYAIYSDRLNPTIAATKRQAEQEALLFSVRKDLHVELKY